MSKRGISLVIILVLIALISLSLFGAASLIMGGSKLKEDVLLKLQAKYIANAGLEYGLFMMNREKNPNNMKKEFSNGFFEINYDGYDGKLKSMAGAYRLDEVKRGNFVVDVPEFRNLAGCVNVIVDNLIIQDSKIKGLKIRNNCSSKIGVKQMVVKWSRGLGMRLMLIKAGQETLFQDAKGMRKNSKVDLSNWVIPECSESEIVSFEFDREIEKKEFNFEFILEDGGKISYGMSY